MLCKKPFGNFGCGQCIPCRINRRRLWTGRILLESTLHEFSTFATLTYTQESCPDELVPTDLRNFWKRLRHEVSVRYFAVGEYGDITFRPHYHAIIFGLPFTAHELVERTWGLGMVHCGDLTPASAAYVTGYVSKKMTAWEDPRLEGKHPEFARMSRNPGLGKKAAIQVSEGLMREGGSKAVAQAHDVPHEIRVSGHKYPLGRFLREAMRDAVGWQPGAPIPVRKALALTKSFETPEETRKLAQRREAHSQSAEARLKIQQSKRRAL